jgi:hypothetical protein
MKVLNVRYFDSVVKVLNFDNFDSVIKVLNFDTLIQFSQFEKIQFSQVKHTAR